VVDTTEKQDEALLLFARLMEGGKEDEETSADLANLTKLLTEDLEHVKQGEPSITDVIDNDCVETIFGYLDMRQPDAIRARATLCTAAYLHAADKEGQSKVNSFFQTRMGRGTYDDFIVAFCAATVIFPIDPDTMSKLIHTEGFLPSLAPLMRRKWKSRKVEMACLEMLKAACMQTKCHPAIHKYCLDWMEELIFEDSESRVETMSELKTDLGIEEGGPALMRSHSEKARNLAGVVWTMVTVSTHLHGAPPRAEKATEKAKVRRYVNVKSADERDKRLLKVRARYRGWKWMPFPYRLLNWKC
jgi:hypothetical protein